ncbi:MAG: ribose 5-phosphate isomerase B [Limnochordales bacterium]|nr:ribose 5-phosphate isomerase B [Limnochordales bacterium]
MRIAIGSDHAGFDLKSELIAYLEGAGHTVEDMGTSGRASCDYPDFARAVAEAVAAGRHDRGILICGTGIGMSIAANKVAGVRAALCGEPYSARLAREHNDANVLCLGARVTGPGLAQAIVAAFLSGEFEGGRHARRVDKIRSLEQ